MYTCPPEYSISHSEGDSQSDQSREDEEDYAEEDYAEELLDLSDLLPTEPVDPFAPQEKVGTEVPLLCDNRYQTFWEQLDYVQFMCSRTADLIERARRCPQEEIKGDFLCAVKNSLAILQDSAIKSLTSDSAVILREYTKPSKAFRSPPTNESLSRVTQTVLDRKLFNDIERDVSGPFNLRLKLKAIEDKALAEKRQLPNVIPLSDQFAQEYDEPFEVIQVPEHGSNSNPINLD